MRTILIALLVAVSGAFGAARLDDAERGCDYAYAFLVPMRVEVLGASSPALSRAIEAYRAGDYPLALVESSALFDSEKGKDALWARALAGFAALGLEDYETASRHLSAVADRPLPPDVRVEVELALGLSYALRSGSQSSMLLAAALSPHLDRPGDGGVARYWLACAALKDGRPDRARALVELLLESATGSRLRPPVMILAAAADVAMNDLPRARSVLEGLVALNPAGRFASLARYLLSHVAMRQGASQAALVYLDEIADARPAPWGGHALLVRLAALEDLGRVDEARRVAAALALEQDPSLSREGTLRGALLAANAADFREAEELLSTLSVDSSDVSAAWVAVARAHIARGDAMGALEAAVRVPDRAPDTTWASAGVVSADAEMVRGNYESALARLLAVRGRISVWSGDDRVSYGLARAYLALRDDRSALDELSRIVATTSDSTLRLEALYFKASTASRLGMWGTALDASREYVAAGPGAGRSVEARMLMGESLYRLGQFAESRRVFREIIADRARGSTAARSTYFIGLSYFDQKNYERALDAFLEVPRYWHTRELGDEAALKAEWCKYYLKRHSSPFEVYEAFLSARPDGPLAPRLTAELAHAFADAGLDPQADSTFDKLEKRYPQSPEVERSALEWSRVLARMGQHERAIAVLKRRAEADTPSSRESKLALGRLLHDRGDRSGALEALAGLDDVATPDDVATEAALLSSTIYRELGLYDGAVSVLDAIIPRLDGLALARAQCAAVDAEVARGRADEALKRYEAYVYTAHGADRALLHLSGARAAVARRDDARAVRLADLAASAPQAAPRVKAQSRFLAADALVRLGKRDEAIDRLERVLDGSSPEDSTEAARRLESLRASH